MTTCFDLVVVGGGISGLCTALEAMRRAPGASIALLDRASIGSGATAHAPGMHVAFGRDAHERELARRGLSGWSGTFREHGIRVGRQCDLLWMTRDPGGVLDGHLSTALEAVEPGRFASSLPSLPLEHVPDGLVALADRAMYTPGPALAAALRTRLASLGCVFLEHAEAHELVVEHDRVTVLRHGAEPVAGRRAVIALGPWTLGSRLGDGIPDDLRGTMRVKKVVAFHLPIRPTPACSALAWFDDYAFLMPFVDEGYWIFSFASRHWDVEPDQPLHADAHDFALAAEILDRRMPGVASQLAPGRVFCDCYPASGKPFVVRHRSSERVAYLGAGAGNGIRFAPPCAEDALDSIGFPRVARSAPTERHLPGSETFAP